MKRFAAAAGIAAMAIVVAGCSGASTPQASSTDLTLAIITPPTSFAPGAMPAGGPEATYYEAVYDTLFALDDDGQPAANLVTEWEYDDTLTRLSLTLRDDVTFTDGTAFDGEAVKANLEAAKAGTAASGQALGFLDSVEVVDATHVVVVLTAPDPSLIANLARSSGYIASPAALGTPDLATEPVGSGPYVLDTAGSSAGDSYVFTRNEDYWNADAYAFDELTIRYIDDTTALLNGLRTGEIDGTFAASMDVISGAEQANLDVVTYTNGNVEGIYLWDRGGKMVPALGDVRVRQAINYAIDREAILDNVKQGLGTYSTQPFFPQDPAHVADLNDLYPYDLDKAKELMEEAGYADGFSMTLPDFSPVYPDEQAAMTEALAALNITIDYVTVTGDQVVGNIIQGQYPVNFFNLSATDAWNFSQLAIAQNGVFNPFHEPDAKVEDLLSRAQLSTGDEQDALMQELNEYVTEQAWFAVWYFQEGAYVTTADVDVTAIPGVQTPPLVRFTPAS